MTTYVMRIKLESDTTFGRGDGLAGVVDTEVEHDDFGLPFLRGRTLKGLLVEECANILFALGKQNADLCDRYQHAADVLFGVPGSDIDSSGSLRVGDACLPADLRQAARAEVERGQLDRLDVLSSLTDVRYQTAMDVTGRPDPHSLRSSRVILRDAVFLAQITFLAAPDDDQLSLLAACTKAFRRAGTARNRGRGRLTASFCDLEGVDLTENAFKGFKKEVEAQ